jgi:hypothetical protein
VGAKAITGIVAKIMYYFKFINSRLDFQRWNRPWHGRYHYLPYSMPHRRKQIKLKFVGDWLFDRYQRAPGKLSVLYWRTHKEES